MVIDLYTLCWNEMDILPFVVDYWKRFVTHAYVYDNGSTDGSVEYLNQFDWIEVRHFDTDGMDDATLRDIKNSVWKESKGKADWVVVCDMDEIVFSEDLEKELKNAEEKGFTIVGSKWYWLCEDSKPVYDCDKLLHQVCTKFYENDGKYLIFNPNEINEIGYSVGAHTINPKGNVSKYESNNIVVFHTNKGFGIDYKIGRYKEMNERQSAKNKANRWSIHYGFSEKALIDDYLKCQKNSFNFNDKTRNVR